MNKDEKGNIAVGAPNSEARAKAENVVVTINPETEKMIALAFGSQNDVENPTKFLHQFLFDAVKDRLIRMATTNVATWERAIDKQQKLHPTQTREQVIADMLASRKARELKELADKAELVKDQIKA